MKQLRQYQQDVVLKLKKRLREVNHPLLVTASVGAGKSLIIAEILLWMERSGYKCLCLTLNSTLIQQNAETYKCQGGHCGIYVGSLDSYDTEPLVIFGSPQSVCNGIRDEKEISKCRFNLIVIDEAHNIHPHDSNTMYQRIINHFGLLSQAEDYSFRTIGLTGTPYRGKGNSIIGPDQFFREEVCNIPASWLIQQGYLTKPIFGLPEAQGYDFSNIRVNSMGKFSDSELQAVIDSNARLTGSIMMELQEVMKTRRGAFIFAATRKHCEECAKSLPDGEWAIITGKTRHEDRKNFLERAKAGNLRYLISVNCLGVGVDVPLFDVCAGLRPTESLGFYTQEIGRVLRLYQGKTEALILDYAGNLQRHGDIDDPIINEALQPKEENEKDYVIPCLTCGHLNCVTARRCIGLVDQRRCSHYFEWKDCPNCQLPNDKTSRLCRGCEHELIDPNAKLSLKPAQEPRETFAVLQAKYWVLEGTEGPQFYCMYSTMNGLQIYESFYIKNDRMKNIFYGVFLTKHVLKPSQYYPVLSSIHHLRKLLESGEIETPNSLECVYEKNHYRIKRRGFNRLPELSDSASSGTG
jgi:DNA repair protein RadD